MLNCSEIWPCSVTSTHSISLSCCKTKFFHRALYRSNFSLTNVTHRGVLSRQSASISLRAWVSELTWPKRERFNDKALSRLTSSGLNRVGGPDSRLSISRSAISQQRNVYFAGLWTSEGKTGDNLAICWTTVVFSNGGCHSWGGNAIQREHVLVLSLCCETHNKQTIARIKPWAGARGEAYSQPIDVNVTKKQAKKTREARYIFLITPFYSEIIEINESREPLD